MAFWALAEPVAAQNQANAPLIGVSAPLSGPTAILGQQVQAGALAASGSPETIKVRDDGCSAEGGAAAARDFAASKVAVVIGFLCTESLEAALPILKDVGIAAITVGVRTDSITDRREKAGWPVFRLAPRGDGEAAAIAGILPKLWRDLPFAIVDDGTIRARDMAETLRAAAEEAQLRPVLVDVFRPDQPNQSALVEKIKKSGAKGAFVAGAAADIAVIAREAARQKYDLTLAGGELLADAPETGLPRGTLMVGLPQWRSIASADVLVALDHHGVLPDGYVLPSYAAAQIAFEAAKTGSAAASLGSTEFTTAIGAVRFDLKGDLVTSPYQLFQYDGQAFAPMESQ